MDWYSKLNPEFRGVRCVLKDGNVLFQSVTGFADHANRIPNTKETRFTSASAGKVFIAAAILQLVERDQISLDDTLGSLLTIDLGKINPKVTVRQLLNHTSGVPDYFDESVMEEYEELWHNFPNYRIRKNSDLFPLFFHKPMIYDPGAAFQYNNSGYVLLAAILEQIYGRPFDQVLQKQIFTPCVMHSTGYFELDRLPGGCAQNYIYCPETKDYRTNIFSVDAKGTGAGGAYVTVEDMIRFWQGLLNGTLLSPVTRNVMFSKQSGNGKDPEEGYYGYGVWLIDRPEKKDLVYVQGCDPGVSFISEYDPESGTISVLVSNYGDNVWKEMRVIRDALYE